MGSSSLILGIIGNVISILMFTSPIKTFKQVIKKKSTENYKGVPYITTLLSTSLWTFYGLLKPDGLLVVTVNGAGAAVHVIYVVLFISYAPKNIKIQYLKLLTLLNIGFLGAVIIATLLAFKGGMRLTLVGLLCAALTVGMYASPLAAMRQVMKTKSVKYMPFFLSFFQFLNGVSWTAYAVLVNDIYIGVPNGVGLLLGSAQLILYMIYYKNGDTSNDTEEKKEEDGSAHLVKRSIQMQDFEFDDEINTKKNNRSLLLSKGNSLPKPSIVRQYGNHNHISKARSLNPYELDFFHKEDLEKGELEQRINNI